MKPISKSYALLAILLWAVSVCLLVPFKEWITINREYNGAKFICVLIGLMVLTRAYATFKKTKVS
ncbi:MAG: hypothetical protein ACHQIM_19250 [Sphingobacteriales bacterium]